MQNVFPEEIYNDHSITTTATPTRMIPLAEYAVCILKYFPYLTGFKAVTEKSESDSTIGVHL